MIYTIFLNNVELWVSDSPRRELAEKLFNHIPTARE